MKENWLTRVRLSGSSALALSTIVTNAIRLVSTMCLTRLLSPSVYGIVGIILSIFYMVNMITDIGLQSYVVRHERSDEPGFLDAVFSIHAVRGVFLAVIATILAWPISSIMSKPQLFAPLVVSSLVFVIDGQVSLHQFRALRDGMVQRFAALDLVTGVSQTITGIILAFLLRNVWAIVGSMLIASSVRAWCTYALFPGGRHQFRRDREVAADLWSFSRVVAISSSLMLVVGQFDKLALGRILPLEKFGLYVLAASLASLPTAFAVNYGSTITYPAVAAAWREGRSIAEAYYGCWRRFFYLYAFAGGGLIGAADLVVRILYDRRYAPVAPYLSILAVSTALSLATVSVERLEVAKGRPRISVEMNIIRLTWLAVGAFLGLMSGNSMVLVITIGSVQVPAYGYGVWRLARTHLVSWSRELSLVLVIVMGGAAGRIASYVGEIILRHI
ncbi:MAG TPA: oligosaccharide flippase family protein [Sphingomicrobium sp.]|nr:oligosaccharide flippase family protein [Sphingomicrobium sp.]